MAASVRGDAPGRRETKKPRGSSPQGFVIEGKGYSGSPRAEAVVVRSISTVIAYIRCDDRLHQNERLPTSRWNRTGRKRLAEKNATSPSALPASGTSRTP